MIFPLLHLRSDRQESVDGNIISLAFGMFFLTNLDFHGMCSERKVFEGENVRAAAEGFAIFIPGKKRFGFFAVQCDRNGAALVIHNPIKTETSAFKGVRKLASNAVGFEIMRESVLEGTINEREIGKNFRTFAKIGHVTGR